ncbi:bifunctional DNA primase/polymerase [Clostridium botulinum]|uniref:bifunctional DNA primase/polymerase n=1 Tax=Clostridium botulinum TaxID=1491 RepID=UPI00077356B0|nr:bifunctional DNA primase/polymerase [Clostridium botulinum]
MDLNLRETIQQHGLLPLVPLTGYSKKPFCQWSKEENWIKDISGCDIKKFSWINKDGEQKQGQVTGFSLLLGKKSNITVIDLDIGHSDNINGIESFKELIKDLPSEDIEIIKSTFTTQTPRGGYHLYFKYVEGIKGIADYFKDINKPGIDVRTEGNLVPIPGTRIQLNGQGKALTYSINNNADIQLMPQSLIDLFKKHQNKPV